MTVPAPSPFLEIALTYAASGWPVFPCDPASKRPLTIHGFKDATRDRTAIKMYWRRWPAAMIAVPTGPLSGFWALDRDIDQEDGTDGIAAFAALGLGELPETLWQTTPRGGRQDLFRWNDDRPVKNSAGKKRGLAHGVDIRGDGGYVIVGGSVRADGRAYEWQVSLDSTELAEAPEWLYEAIAKIKAEPPSPSSPPSNIVPMDRARTGYALAALDDECRQVETAPKGTRNDQLNTSAFKLATLVAAGALSEGAVQDALASAAQRAGLATAEITATLRSAFRAGVQHPRELPERRDDPPIVLRPRSSAAVAEPDPEHPTWHFRVTPYSDIAEEHNKAWTIKGLFGSGEMSVVYGLPSCGKSVLMTDAACHVASGLEWFGHKVSEGVVLYLAAEREAVVKRRLAAWRKRHGVLDIPLVVVAGFYNLLDLRSGHAEEIGQIGQWYAEFVGKPVVWAIIDTKQQTMAGGDPNSDKDIGAFVDNIYQIQAALGCHVTVIDHVPHGSPERLKGSGALAGASDGAWLVKKEGGARVLTIGSKPPNDAADDFELAFDLEGVVVGVNDDGEETTAPVVIEGRKAPKQPDAAPSSRGRKQLPASAQKVMAAYGRLFDQGKDHPAPNLPGVRDGTRAVALNDLREQAYELGIGPPMPSPDEDDFIKLHKDWLRARRKAFADGIERLDRDGMMRFEQGFAWEVRGNLRGVFDD